MIQEVLRHANIRTTADRYTLLVPQAISDALATMDRTFLPAEAE
jgi:integrase